MQLAGKRAKPSCIGMCLLAAWVLLLAGCSATHGAESTLLASPLSTPIPIPTATQQVVASPTLGPVMLVVLHTNDNWGETEPCG